MSAINILTLDGGGVRGIIEIIHLIELEKNIGELHKVFDYISGTSTGSIIAAMLSVGYSSAEILDLYIKESKYIFKRKWYRMGLLRPKFDDKYFNKLLDKYLGDKTFDDTLTNLIIPSYDLNGNSLKLFNKKYLLKDVVRASTAYPLYLKSHKIRKKTYIDGGIIANNPTLITVLEAFESIDKNNIYESINVFSLSTSQGTYNHDINKIDNGIIYSAKTLINLLLTEQTKLVDYNTNLLFNILNTITDTKCNYIRCKGYINMSSKSVFDASEKNLRNLIKDGIDSVDINRENMKTYIKYIT